MIKSMTGYGKAEAVLDHKKITVEIRSLNSKQLDLTVKVPPSTGKANTKSATGSASGSSGERSTPTSLTK